MSITLDELLSVSVDDGGGSLTVDGTVSLGAGAASIGTLGANDGVDIGDVTVNNAAGASAVNIQDGGNSITIDDGGSPISIDDNGGSITVDGTVATTPGGLSTWQVSATSVDTTAGGTELAATPLANRVKMIVQNLGANNIYVKDATGVTTANGLKIPKQSSQEIELSATANIWAITDASTADVRVAEYAA